MFEQALLTEGFMLMIIGFVLLGLVFLMMICPSIREWVLYDKETRLTRHYFQLLIDRANSGNETARIACDNNGLINKGIAVCEDGVKVRSLYSLPTRWL